MSRKPAWVLAAAVAVIVSLAVVAAVVRATQSSPDLDLSTPEGTVQAFLEATFAHDYDEAAGYLDPDGRCTVEDLERGYADTSGTVALLGTTMTDTGARVQVEVAYSDGPLGVGRWTEPQTYRLSEDADGWVLLDVPWPLFDCGADL
jgi:hypothetical protein